MKNQKFTQFLSCATMFAIMSSMTACGEKGSNGGNNNNNNERPVQTAGELITNSYSSESIDTVPEDIQDIRNIAYSPADDVYYCNAYIGTSYDNVIYSISADFSTFTPMNIELDESKENYINNMNVLSDGGFAVFINEVSYGDLPPIDYDDTTIDWENFDWAPYEEAREETYIYRMYDKDGKMTSSVNLQYESGEQYDYVSGYYGFSDGSSVCYSESQGFVKFDKDGKSSVLGKADDIQWIDSIGSDSDGNLLVSGYGNEEGYIFAKYDLENKSVSEKFEYENNIYNSQNCIIRGVGDYSFFVLGDKALSGYNKNTKQFDEIVNWLDSDISNVTAVIVDKDMQISIIENAQGGYREGVSFSRLKKRDSSELANQQIITVGMLYNNENINSKVAEFNKSNKDYRIRTVDYSQYDNEENEYTGSVQQLNQDLISGKAPDIIVSSGNLNMQSLASKGVFADLYNFIDKDSELNRESFVPNILELSECDGKLVSIPVSFNMQTLAGKTKYVGEKQNWTVDDMISAYENRPKEDMGFSINDYKTNMFYMAFYANLNSHIDYKNKTFTYDKAELVKLLEFINQFEEEPDWNDEAVTLEQQSEWDDYQTSMIKDKYLIYDAGIYDFRSYHELLAGTFANEPVTLVGYPSADGSGVKLLLSDSVFSIVSNSANKDACWNFIRQFLTEDYQSPSDDGNGNNNIWSFPVNQKAFDKLAEQSKSPRFWIDPETGKKTEYETTFWAGDKEIKIGDCTDEEIAQVKDLINNIKTASNYYDSGLYKICEEETGAFFKGDKSAEETADLMINRISIYIAEKG